MLFLGSNNSCSKYALVINPSFPSVTCLMKQIFSSERVRDSLFSWPRWDWRWTKTAVLAVWWSRRDRESLSLHFFLGRVTTQRLNKLCHVFMVRPDEFLKNHVYKMGIHFISSCLVWGISSHVNASYPLRVHAKGIEVLFLLKTSRI